MELIRSNSRQLNHGRIDVLLTTREVVTTLAATRDHDVIRDWAARQQAEPATGEATSSGPATVNVRDGGAGIRFNFPGAARFRPIDWNEWFAHFDQHHLVFVFAVPREEDVAARAYELWQARGRKDGHALDDWLTAEEQVRRARSDGAGDAQYRLMREGLLPVSTMPNI
jgi:hypothetical protein